MFFGQGRRDHLAVDAEREVAAGRGLQLRRQRVIEQEADIERAKDVRPLDPQRNRNAEQLQQAVRFGEQRHGLVPGERRTRRPGVGDLLRAKTGLPLATYFSALKLVWLLDNVPAARAKAKTT